LHLKQLRSVEQHYAAFKMAEAQDPAFGTELKERMVKYVVTTGGEDKGSTVAVVNNNPHDLFTARQKALAIISGQPALAEGIAYEGPLKDVKAKTDAFHYCVACGEACGPVKCEWCDALQDAGSQAPWDAAVLILQQGREEYAGCQGTYTVTDKTDQAKDDRLTIESNGVGGNLKAVAIKFAIPEDKVIPSATVHKATLTLYCMRQSCSTGKIKVSMLNGPWNIPLQYNDGSNLAGKELMVLTVSNYRTVQGNDINPPVPVVFDITHAVRNWVPDKHINFGVILLPSGDETVDLRFVSSADDRSEFRPRLEIEYTR